MDDLSLPSSLNSTTVDNEYETGTSSSSSESDLEESVTSDSSSSTSASERCPICYSRFSGQETATPETCDHLFCLLCISEWAKNANTCPIDRQNFSYIHVKDAPDSAVLRRIAVEKLVDDRSQLIADDDVTPCRVCGQTDREDRLLLCDGCDAGYHLECLTPPLNSVPIEEWFCPRCQPRTEVRTEDGEILVDVELRRGTQRHRRAGAHYIPRTQATERILSAIATVRALVSTLDVDEMINVAGPSTSRAPIKRRRVFRRRRRRYKKSTKKSAGGTSKGKTSKEGCPLKRRRRRKTKRRRKTTFHRRKRRRVLSDSEVTRGSGGTRRGRSASPEPTVRNPRVRIADQLGLVKRPLKRLARLDEIRAPLRLFGNDNQLLSFDLDDTETTCISGPGPSLSNQPSSKHTKSSVTLLNKSKAAVTKVIKSPCSSSTRRIPDSSVSSSDLLSSILDAQTLLCAPSSHVTIRSADGSLNPSPKLLDKIKHRLSSHNKRIIMSAPNHLSPTLDFDQSRGSDEKRAVNQNEAGENGEKSEFVNDRTESLPSPMPLSIDEQQENVTEEQSSAAFIPKPVLPDSTTSNSCSPVTLTIVDLSEAETRPLQETVVKLSTEPRNVSSEEYDPSRPMCSPSPPEDFPEDDRPAAPCYDDEVHAMLEMPDTMPDNVPDSEHRGTEDDNMDMDLVEEDHSSNIEEAGEINLPSDTGSIKLPSGVPPPQHLPPSASFFPGSAFFVFAPPPPPPPETSSDKRPTMSPPKQAGMVHSETIALPPLPPSPISSRPPQQQQPPLINAAPPPPLENRRQVFSSPENLPQQNFNQPQRSFVSPNTQQIQIQNFLEQQAAYGSRTRTPQGVSIGSGGTTANNAPMPMLNVENFLMQQHQQQQLQQSQVTQQQALTVSVALEQELAQLLLAQSQLMSITAGTPSLPNQVLSSALPTRSINYNHQSLPFGAASLGVGVGGVAAPQEPLPPSSGTPFVPQSLALQMAAQQSISNQILAELEVNRLLNVVASQQQSLCLLPGITPQLQAITPQLHPITPSPQMMLPTRAALASQFSMDNSGSIISSGNNLELFGHIAAVTGHQQSMLNNEGFIAMSAAAAQNLLPVSSSFLQNQGMVNSIANVVGSGYNSEQNWANANNRGPQQNDSLTQRIERFMACGDMAAVQQPDSVEQYASPPDTPAEFQPSTNANVDYSKLPEQILTIVSALIGGTNPTPSSSIIKGGSTENPIGGAAALSPRPIKNEQSNQNAGAELEKRVQSPDSTCATTQEIYESLCGEPSPASPLSPGTKKALDKYNAKRRKTSEAPSNPKDVAATDQELSLSATSNYVLRQSSKLKKSGGNNKGVRFDATSFSVGAVLDKEQKHSRKEKQDAKREERYKKALEAGPTSSSKAHAARAPVPEETRKEKVMAKIDHQLDVENMVKAVLKPYFSKNKITKEDYKDIMRKSVPKIATKTKGRSVNPVKVKAFVEQLIAIKSKQKPQDL